MSMPIGSCAHAPVRCRPCLQRQIEIHVLLRRGLTAAHGPMAGLGKTLGGPDAWASTVDDGIARLICELVAGVPSDRITWALIERQQA